MTADRQTNKQINRHILITLLLLQPFLWGFVRDYPGEPVPEETFTHSHLSYHQPSLITYDDPQYPPCSIYVTHSHFAQPPSKSCLVYLFVWHPSLQTPYISSPNHCLIGILRSKHSNNDAVSLCKLLQVCLHHLN